MKNLKSLKNLSMIATRAVFPFYNLIKNSAFGNRVFKYLVIRHMFDVH